MICNISKFIPQSKKNFNQATNGSKIATQPTPLTKIEWNLLLHILWYQKRKMTCYESMRAFADKFKVSERQIQRLFKNLKDMGLVVLRYMGKRGNALKYVTESALAFLNKVNAEKNRAKRKMSGPRSGPMSGPDDPYYINNLNNENNNVLSPEEEKKLKDHAAEQLLLMKKSFKGLLLA